MKPLYNFLIVAGLISLMTRCSQEEYRDPIDKDKAPGNVYDVQVTPLPGAAKISYKLPDDRSLRYVKALYEIRPGVEREAKSSLYSDHLTVDGFPEEKSYDIRLYTVSYGENESQPTVVSVTPLMSPLTEAYNSLTLEETFGGTTVKFDNSGAASLAVMILTDSLGELREIETYYTNSITGAYSVRGFPNEPRRFGAVIRDRWGNLSDTITRTITPLFEEFIPKDLFRTYHLPTDTYTPHAGANHTVDKIWDGRIAPQGGIAIFHTPPGSGMPQWFTFDMGREVMLSRYKFWHRGPGDLWAYKLAAPKKWEIWGMTETPDPTGSWDGWIKLMDCESYQPSGQTPPTNEDYNYATNLGEDFTFPDNIPSVRYIRFKMLETWGYLDYHYMQEVSFWGKVL